MKLFTFLIMTLMLSFTFTGCGGTAQTDGGVNISLSASVSTGGRYINALAIDGALLYAAAGYDGIIVYTISDSTNLVESTNIVITNFPVMDITVKTIASQKYLFAILGSYTNVGGLAIFEVTSAPSGIYATNISNNVAGVKGNALAVNETTGLTVAADEFKGLQFYTNMPALADIRVGHVVTLNGKSAQDLDISGTSIFAAARENGVYIVDSVSRTVQAHIGLPVGYAAAVDADGNNLAVADRGGTVYFYDVSLPASPRYKGYFQTGGEVSDVIISGSDVYVACGTGGFAWLDITTLTAPVRKGYITPAGSAQRLSIAFGSGGYIYAAYGLDGIKVFKK